MSAIKRSAWKVPEVVHGKAKIGEKAEFARSLPLRAPVL
jgi:hypothetical protein